MGLFAAKDVFIATNFASREQLPGWNTPEWKAAKARARTAWRNMFPGYDPLNDTDVKQLVTGAIDGKYFR